MDGFVGVGRLTDFAPGVMLPFKVGDSDVAVCNVDGELHAFSNFCPHEAVTLTSGYGVLIDGKIVCMLHTSVFDVASGEVLGGPADSGLTKYGVKIVSGEVFVASNPQRT